MFFSACGLEERVDERSGTRPAYDGEYPQE